MGVTAAALPSAPAPQSRAAIAAGPKEAQAQSISSAHTPAKAPRAQQAKHKLAEEQLKAEEKQRVVGIVPAFGTSYVWNAVSLTAGQKMQLAFRSAIDPFTFAAAFLSGGYHELDDNDAGYGWGAQGYFKRAGASYLDAFDGGMIGNGILPAILHQDPRYFRLGHGSAMRRILYSAATTFICKGDNGRWQPNYSNVAGNIIAGAISNLYYPPQNAGWGETITNGFIVTFEGTAGGEFQEFWPDISRKFFHHDPAHGRDAQSAAQDNATPK